MIRVRVESREPVPDSLIPRLQTGGVEISKDSSYDAILIYVRFWRRSAIEEIQPILNPASKPLVILCQQYEEPFATDSLLRKYVSGILLNDGTTDQIIAGLTAAAAGLKFLQPIRKRENIPAQIETLTPRELEILNLIADGEGNKSIANLLGISQHTVKFHIGSIFEKLHVSSRTEAIRAGLSRGLILI